VKTITDYLSRSNDWRIFCQELQLGGLILSWNQLAHMLVDGLGVSRPCPEVSGRARKGMDWREHRIEAIMGWVVWVGNGWEGWRSSGG
jgi:hypothetical protein